MKTDTKKLFPQLTPPPGGAQLLRSKLNNQVRHKMPLRPALAVSAVVIVVLVLNLLREVDDGDHSTLRPNSPLLESAQIKAWLDLPQEPLIVFNEQQQPLPIALVHQAQGVRIYEIKALSDSAH